jgi:hypothetical protein
VDGRRVSVSVDDEHLEAIGAVVDALRGQGMRVEQVMDQLGIISGVVPEGAHAALMGVEGVVSIDESQGYQLPPPDSPVQ